MVKRLKTKKKLNQLNIYYGLNFTQKKRILTLFGFNNGNLNYNDLLNLENFIRKNFLIEYKLKLKIHNNIKNLIKLKNYKGFRHRYKLPLNGQNTRVNRITARNYQWPKIDKKYIDDTFKLLKLYNE